MERPRFSAFVIGSITFAARQIASAVLVTRIGGPAAIGEYGLALSLTAPPFLLAGLGMRKLAAVRDPAVNPVELALRVRLAAGVLALLVAVAVSLIWSAARPHLAAVLAVGFAKLVEHQADLAYGYLQASGENRQVGRSLAVKGALMPGAIGLGMATTGRVPWAVALAGLGWLTVYLLHDRPRLLESTSHLRASHAVFADLRTLLRSGLLLGATAAVVSLGPNVARYLLQQAWGVEALGLYTMMAYGVSAGSVVINALGQSFLSPAASWVARGEQARLDRARRAMTVLCLCIAVAASAFFVVVGDGPIVFLLGDAFMGTAPLFALLMLLSFFQYRASLENYFMTSQFRYRAQFAAGLAGLLVGSVVSVLLIPGLGVLGAIMAFGATYGVQFVAQRSLSRRA